MPRKDYLEHISNSDHGEITAQKIAKRRGQESDIPPKIEILNELALLENLLDQGCEYLTMSKTVQWIARNDGHYIAAVPYLNHMNNTYVIEIKLNLANNLLMYEIKLNAPKNWNVMERKEKDMWVEKRIRTYIHQLMAIHLRRPDAT